MTYSDKVKASNIIINAINGLTDGQYIIVTYGTNYDNEPQRFKISCNIFRGGKPSYSIYKDEVFGLSGMNIDSINNFLCSQPFVTPVMTCAWKPPAHWTSNRPIPAWHGSWI